MQVRLEKVQQRFGERSLLAVPALTIEPGELFVVVGPAGAGKSTLLGLVAGLEEPSDGMVMLDERVVNELSPEDRGIGVVTSETMLEAVDHQICVMDDPLRTLEPRARADRRDALRRHHRGSGRTIVYATTDAAEALALADRMAVVDAGRIHQVGSPAAILERPATTFVASCFGAPPMNVVPGILEKDGVAVEIGPRSIQLNGVVTRTYARDVFLGIRPEHVRLAVDRPSGWRGTVTAVEQGDEGAAVTVTVDMGTFVAYERGEVPYRVGQAVTLTLAARDLHLFDDRGGRLDIV